MTDQPVTDQPAPVSARIVTTSPRASARTRKRSRAAVARSTGGDRWVATLVGLVVAAIGAGAALLAFGVFGPGRAQRPLLDPMVVDWMRAQPLAARLIAIGAGVLLAALGLVWAARSVRPERRPDVPVDGGGDTSILVTSAAVAEAVAGQALTLPGVGKAKARMVGSDRAPALRVTLWLADDCDVTSVLNGLEDQVLTAARDALGLAELPVAVRLELDTPAPAPRVA